jgi:hypothetical protein
MPPPDSGRAALARMTAEKNAAQCAHAVIPACSQFSIRNFL